MLMLQISVNFKLFLELLMKKCNIIFSYHFQRDINNDINLKLNLTEFCDPSKMNENKQKKTSNIKNY